MAENRKYLFEAVVTENGTIVSFPRFIQDKVIVSQISFCISRIVPGRKVLFQKYSTFSRIKKDFNSDEIIIGVATFDNDKILASLKINGIEVNLKAIGFNPTFVREKLLKNDNSKNDKDKENVDS